MSAAVPSGIITCRRAREYAHGVRSRNYSVSESRRFAQLIPEGGVMVEKLDAIRLQELLREADDLWLNKEKPTWQYVEHLEFTAKHIANNYHRKKRKGG